MSGIDERVVEMQFDNKAFGEGVKTSLNDLENLKKGLKLEGATSGLDDVSKAASRFSLRHISDAVDGIGQKLTAMSIIGITALTNLVNKAINAGEQMAKSLTIAPVSAGFHEYELMMGSIQTILANTQRYGTQLPEIMDNLNQLNEYADKTIYNFGDMTRNIGLFTNAGIRVGDATSMIKGFSNVAASSGTSAEAAAGAARQLAQALSVGTIRAMDWISLTSAQMGNKNMQEGLVNIAEAMDSFSGKGLKAADANKDFKGSLEKGWLSADVMSAYLRIMAGEMDAAAMSALGLTDAQVKGFIEQQKMAEESATKVRTFTQLIGTVREAIGSGWSETFRTLFGDFNEATDLFTGLNNAISGFVGHSSEARNSALADWKALGGRTDLIDGLKAAWQALSGVLGPIHDAFREIFPKKTGQDLMNMTTAFKNFMQSLVPGPALMENIKRTFAGFFAVLDIGWHLLKAGVHFIADLIGHFSKGGGSVLEFTGNIGDFLVKLDQAIKKGDIFGKFFDKLKPLIEGPIDGLKKLVGFIVDLVKAIASADAVTAILDRFHKNFQQMSAAGDAIGGAWERVKIIFGAIWKAVQPVVQKIGDIFKDVAGGVASFLASISFGDILAGAGVAAFVALILKIRSTIDNLFNKKQTSGPGVFDKIKAALDQLTGTLQAMQNALKAATILAIAAAIGILTIAVSVLSKIDAGGLARATSAIAVMIIELTGAMVMMDKLLKKSKAIKMGVLAAGLILLAIAIDVLASAAKKLASLDWNELAKGLTGTVVLLAAVAGAMKFMPSKTKMVTTGAGILLIATAIKVLASAAKDIADLNWGEIAKGLTGVAGLLTSLALFTKFSKISSIGDGAGILLIAAAIKVLASAMKDISNLSWEEIAKGLVGVAGGLTAMVAALKLIPKGGNFGNSAAILVVAAAMKILASAVKDMGNLSWNEIAKGVVGLAGGLVAISAALKMLPDKNFAQAASILLVTAAIKILASAMQDMGSMSWNEIAKSLVELAGALLIINIALAGMDIGIAGAAALVIVAYAIQVLAKAMTVMGGMTWSDIAAALVELAAALTIIVIAVNAMEVALPGAAALVVVAYALGMLADVLVKMGAMSWSDIGAAIGELALLFAVLAIGGALSPLIILLGAALVVLGGGIALAGAGINAMGTGLNAFADGMTKLSQISPEGLNNVSNAIERMIGLLPLMATALADSIANFITELGNRSPEMAQAIGTAISAMVDEITTRTPDIVAAFMDMITQSLQAIADRSGELVTAGANIIVNTLNGIAENTGRMISAGVAIAVAFMQGIGDSAKPIADAGFQMIIQVMNGIAESIRQNAQAVKDAAMNIGHAIIDGITGGVSDPKKQSGFISKISTMANTALGVARNILGVQSPSKEFEKIGKYVVEGFANGISGNSKEVDDAAATLASNLLDSMEAAVKDADDATAKIKKLTAARDDHNRALREANRALSDAKKGRKGSANSIRDAEEKVRKATEAVNADNVAIRESTDALAEANTERERMASAYKYVTDTMTAEKLKLESLAGAYDDVTTRLEDANKALDDARKTRDDYNASVRSQYDDLPDLSKDTHLTSFVDALKKQVEDTKKFASAIQKLRDLGLNDEMYKQLITSGTDTLPFVNELLAGGASKVAELNDLGLQLDAASSSFASSASASLYQAAVDSAAGLVQGLTDQQAAIKGQMTTIADSMLQAVKDRLGIQSPSKELAAVGDFAAQGLVQGLTNAASAVNQASVDLGNNVIQGMIQGITGGLPGVSAAAANVAQQALAAAMATLGIASPSKEFIKIGRYSSEGLAVGLENYSDVVSNAATGVGNDAISAMRKSISGLGDLIAGDVDLNPVVTPVLDLSSIQKDAVRMGSMLNAEPIAVGVAYSRASDASAGYQENRSATTAETTASTARENVTFNQYNNSPKSLSSVEIYRQTKNQISAAKGALAK